MSGDELNPFVYEFDDLIAGPLANFLALSQKLGGHVGTISKMAGDAVQTQRHFLTIVSRAIKPDQPTLSTLLQPTSEQIQAVQTFREKNRTSEYFNHLSAISESIGALGWVAVSPTPAPYVKEMKDASQFYTNKVLVQYKEKDKTHVEWAKAWVEFLTELQAFVKKNHTTGLVWNPRGVDANTIIHGSTGAAPAAGGPPPPPPPPPADIFAAPAPAKDNSAEARNALLKDLNRGTDITSGLRKVTDDQKTHKNPNLRASNVVAASDAPAGRKAATNGYAKEAPPKPPKFELEGKKWMVEYQNGRKDIVIQETEMNQSVNLYKCKDTVVQVKGKINSITVDSCSKTAIVFDDLVAVVEFINCQSVQGQSMGKVPTINIEKTDGAQIFLSKESIAAEIVTAKCSAINVCVPNEAGDDVIEHPIPEQFKSIFNGKVFKTTPAENTA